MAESGFPATLLYLEEMKREADLQVLGFVIPAAKILTHQREHTVIFVTAAGFQIMRNQKI